MHTNFFPPRDFSVELKFMRFLAFPAEITRLQITCKASNPLVVRPWFNFDLLETIDTVQSKENAISIVLPRTTAVLDLIVQAELNLKALTNYLV